MLQVMQKYLPDHLVQEVLGSSKVKLKDQLTSLPDDLRTHAIYAAFPNIMTDGSIALQRKYDVISRSCSYLLWPHLHKIKELKTLNLDGLRLGKGHFGPFLECLGAVTTLTCLNLRENFATSGNISYLVTALMSHTDLQQLDLSDNQLDDKCIEQLVPYFKHAAYIRHLTINGEITADTFAQFAGSLSNLASLEFLSIQRFGMNAEKAMHISQEITKISTLRALSISGHELNAEGLRTVAQSMHLLPKLQRLDLAHKAWGRSSGPFFCLSTVEVVGRQLADCTNLNRLDLSNINLGNDGLLALMTCLSRLTRLEVLRLDEIAATLEGVHAVIPCFQALSSLMCLSLYSSGSGTKDMGGLEALPGSMPQLSVLHVDHICEWSRPALNPAFYAHPYPWNAMADFDLVSA